jgi:hypothetical protein
MSQRKDPLHPPVAPRPGENSGYDDAYPHSRRDLSRDRRDARGLQDGKMPNPEVGGLARDPVTKPDPAED